MFRFAFITLLFGVSLHCKAQYNFMYFENSTKTVFTVKFNNNIYSSETKGFVIISKIESGSYDFFISANGNKERQFNITITDDIGFKIHQSDEGNMSLTNIATNEILEDATTSANKIAVQKINDSLLADIRSKSDSQFLPTKNSIAEPKPNHKKEELIKRIVNKKNEDGVDQIYIVKEEDKFDTVAIFIPFATPTLPDTIKLSEPEPVIEKSMPATNIDIVNNNCNHIATEKDVAEFAAQIQATVSLKSKLKIAGNMFKKHCYTVSQIKRLSVIFNNDSGKLSFFKIAKQSVVDASNFKQLANELNDEINRQEFEKL